MVLKGVFEDKMPTYEYECEDCGKVFEKFQMMREERLKECLYCGGSVKRLIGAGMGIIYKGGGFYTTDYGSGSGGRKGEGKGEGKGEEADQGKGEGKGEEANQEKGEGNVGGAKKELGGAEEKRFGE